MDLYDISRIYPSLDKSYITGIIEICNKPISHHHLHKKKAPTSL
ncbi:hypothetical protein HMPREF9083_0646 [Dialister micraerophilus DSM 19965]|uniref:Uncharacterized protein n=1 Tax=Dialister micraerophilus DSM 19965 TaxID=888062 RepID=F2BWS8_9FIRM|nr:hypothetical protein HMPREF9083_0646 [Dialister micraerophilus DSM 19965]